MPLEQSSELPAAPERVTAMPAPIAAPPSAELSPATPTLWTRARDNAVPLIALVLGFLAALRLLRRRD